MIFDNYLHLIDRVCVYVYVTKFSGLAQSPKAGTLACAGHRPAYMLVFMNVIVGSIKIIYVDIFDTPES